MNDFVEFFCKLKTLVNSVDGVDWDCDITNFEEAKCAVDKAVAAIEG